MKYSNSIEYNISTKLDKSGLTQLQTQIKQVELTMQQMANRELISAPKVQAAREQLQGLSTALTKSFNPSLGMLDLSKFRAELTESKVTAEGLQTAFSLTGAQGAQAFGTLAKQIGNFNNGIERTSSTLDKMFVTFSNTFRWGLISSFFSQFMNAIHQSVQYAKDLDDSLTQIMLVTDYSRDSMNEYAKAANEAAKAVGQTTVGMTNASLIFAQQGYDLNQSQQLATLSAKLANASQQDTAATSDQITAYMNAYGLQNSMDELVQAMDNWAKIANISAADVEEIALASQRAASMANAVGVSGEALAAQIATIESVTREAPEQIGNGLKTLYARFSDLKLGKDDEDGIGLGKVTSTLQQIGVQVLDAFGNVRDMDDIMEDLMVVWEDLDDTSKTAAAQALAGKHQVNRFMALMENVDMYREYKGATGASASGTLEEMNAKYLDSLQGRMTKLQSTLEGLFNDVFTTDMVYPLIDALTGLADAIDVLFKSVGGGPTVILGLASAFTRLFSQNIARGINDMISNQQIANIRKSNLANVQGALEQTGLNNTGVGQYIQAGADRAKAMNAEQYRAYTEQLDNYIAAAQNAAIANEKLEDTYRLVGAAAGVAFKNTDLIFKDEESVVNTSNLVERLNDVLKDKEALQQLSNIDYSKAVSGAEEYATALGKLNTSIYTIKKEGEQSPFASWNLDQSLNALDNVEKALNKLHASGGLTNDEFAEGKAILDEATNELAEFGTVSEDTSKKLQNLNGGMARFAEALKRINPEILKQGPEAIEQAIREQIARMQAEEEAAKAAQGVIVNLDRQQVIQGLINTIGAVQQLAFAWQAFQNLGSLWAREDLDNGEKILQTILNLTMAMPQLISAMQTLQNSKFFSNIGTLINIPNISKVATDIQELIKQGDIAKKALGQIGEELETAAKAGSLASQEMLDELKAAAKAGDDATLSFLGVDNAIGKAMAKAAAEGASGLGILGAAAKAALIEFWPLLAIGAAIAGISFIIGKHREETEQAKQAALEYLSVSNEFTESSEKTLKDIEKLYDTWKKTGEGAEELEQSLRDQAEALGVVVTAADNYETLIEKIREATAAQLEYNAALKDESPERAEWDFSGLSAETYEQIGASTHKEGIFGANGDTEILTWDVLDQDQNFAQLYANTLDLRDEVLQKINANEHEMLTADEAHYLQLQQENKGLREELDTYENILSTNKAKYEEDKAIVEQRIQAEALYSDSAFKNVQTYEETLAILERVPGFLKLATEDQRQLALQALEWAGNTQAAAEAQMALAEYQVQQNDVNNMGFHQGERGLTMIDTLSDQQGLTAEQKASIVSMIDWTDPEVDVKVAELLSQIREGLENGISIDDILAGTGNGLNIDPEEYLSTITSTDADVDDEALRDTAKAIYEYNDQLAEYADDIEDFPKIIKEAAEAQVRYNKAVERTVDNIDDWKEVLEDLEDANPEDLAKTTKELRNTYEDLLDLDTDSLSDAFIVDPSNLKSLEAAINGDIDAYWDLWEAAQADILIQAGMDDTQAYEAAANLRSILYDNGWDDIEIGASLTGKEELLAAFEDIINAAGMTADQAQQYLASMGVDAEVKEESEITEDEKEAYGWRPVETSGIDVPVSAPVKLNEAGTGLDTVAGSFHIGGFRMEPVPMTDTATSTTTALSMETTSGGYSSGGNLHINRSTARKSGGGGGQKRSGSAAPRSSGGGGGGSCFAAGTLISLQDQFKNIEDIQIGDIVLSYNEEIHQNEYSIVLQTMIHDVTEEIYDLYIEDEILTVTGIHRFYVRHKHDIEWIPTSDLHIGDYVLFADGNWHPIFKIKVKVRSLLVYNFEVSHNHNYYVGRNQILAHNKGGKGGGGGSAKTIEKKEKKKHEKDYYEEVDSQLDKIKEQLTGIEKQEDKLIGDKARANQAKQIALLNREITLQERKLEILQKQEIPETKTKLDESITELENILSKYGLNLNMPKLEYDEDGIISNFEDISQLITDKYNELVSKQGAIADSADEEANKQIEKAMSNFDKAGDKTKDLIQKLNDLQKTQVEWTNAIQESKDAVEDLNIELYKTSMETIDNLKDLNEKWAEFEGLLTGMPSDSPFRDLMVDLLKLNSTFEISKKDAEEYYQQIIDGKLAAQKATNDQAEKEAIQASINYFKGLKEGLTDDMLKNGFLGLAMEDLKQLEKWYHNDPTAGKNPFGENQKALAEAYQEGYERVKELAQEWQDTEEDIVEKVIDGYDEIADKQDRQLEKYKRLAEELETMADIYALSYGDESYQALSDIGKRQAETLKAQLTQYVSIYEYWQAEYEAAQKAGDEKLMNHLEDRMNDVQDEMRDLAQEAAEAFAEAYENAMDAAVQNMYQGLFGENNLDHLDRNWEWDKKVIDNYRDEVEKTFEIEQLRSKYNELLNDAQSSSLATQNKIRKQMQEQLDLLKNQESMSEYDVQLANSKLLILQKQIALEDAQRNKNQMQLRRDSQGNYRYVYRASQNDIAKARDEYMQAVQDAYELTKEQRQKTAEELKETLKDYASTWRDISTDMNLTEEQRLVQSQELTEKFLTYMKHLNEDLTDSQLGMSDVLNFMVENGTADVADAAKTMLSQLFDEEGNLLEDTGIEWWDFGNNLAEKLFPYIENATSNMNKTLADEAKELRNKLTGEDGVITNITKALVDEEGLRPALEDIVEAITGEGGLDEAMTSLTESLADENAELDKGIEKITAYTKGLAEALEWLKTAQETIKDLQNITVGELVYETSAPLPEEAKPKEEPKPAATTTTTTTKPAAKPATNTNKLNKDRVLAAYNEIMSGRAGNGDARWRYLTNKGYTNAEQDAAQAVVNAVYGGSGRDAALKRIVGYASGGYTGEWNNNGKLAILHQKELVLNAEDTRNILSAVDIVRQMTSTLGNVLANYSIGDTPNSLASSIFNTVDQRVEIKAEFPNVRDAFEIETALTNLADKAYQYAHRKI